MLLLVCLFFTTYFYASEDNISLLTVTVEDNSSLLTKVKNEYLRSQEYWEAGKVHFYNLKTNDIQSYNINENILNLCKNIEQIGLHNITHSVRNFFKNNAREDLVDTFNLLFNALPNHKLNVTILYHFKLFLYTTASTTDQSIKTIAYNDFLMSYKQIVSNSYQYYNKLSTRWIFGSGALLACTFGGMALGMAMMQTPPSPMIGYCSIPNFFHLVIAVPFYAGDYFAYRKCLKLVEGLETRV